MPTGYLCFWRPSRLVWLWGLYFLGKLDGFPNPPSDFGEVTISHFRVWVFCLLEVPQMKFLYIWSILSVMCFGRSVNCIEWVGMMLRHDFARVVLPAMFRNFVFHPASFELRLSMMNWKFLFVARPYIIGRPRYLPKMFPLFILRFFVIDSFRLLE